MSRPLLDKFSSSPLSALSVLRSSAFRDRAATPASAVEAFYGSIFHTTVSVSTSPLVANLLSYVATFPDDPTINPYRGVVDAASQYFTIGGTVVTDAGKIAKLLAKATPAPDFNDFNLNAYTVPIDGVSVPMFVDNANQYALLFGQLFDLVNGIPLTLFVNMEVIPSDFAVFLYESARKFRYLLEGNPSACKTIWVFGEPNCPDCHDFYAATLPFVTANALSIRWTFASFIKDTSRGQVFAIWDGAVPAGSGYPPTPLGAFVYNETFFTPPDNGGIPPETDPSKCAVKFANRSQQYFLENLLGTPFIIYKDQTGTPAFSFGPPSDITAFVKSIRVKCPCEKR